MLQECKYRLPCNWCDKYDKLCDAVLFEIYKQEQEQIQNPKSVKECKHEWYIVGSVTGTKSKYEVFVCSECGEQQTIKTVLDKENGTYKSYLLDY